MPNLTREIVRRLSDADERTTNLERQEWTGPVRGCHVIRTTAATIANNALTIVAFSTAAYDLGACWSAAASTHLIAPRDGYYVISANIGWQNGGDGDGTRILQVYDNTVNCIASVSQHGSSDAYIGQHVATPPVHLDTGDYCTIRVYQSSGAAMLVSTASAQNPYFCQASILRMH